MGSPALKFEVVARHGKARAARMTLPHYTASTPMFMPVGTQGTVKGLTSKQLEELDCHVILGNTYHLGLRPGGDLLEKMGGLHELMRWDRGMLTDSGGFQMVSLLHLAEITEQGVKFQSPHDGSEMMLTPEESMHIQNQIGADIMMALDDVVHSTTGAKELAMEYGGYTGGMARVAEATDRTTRWLDRCIAAHKRPNEQNLFAIIQGGLDKDLRKKSLDDLIARDTPGYAIGGLSGGEAKSEFWRVVDQCTDHLPEDKPRYCMGVGFPLDLVVCSSLGVDMCDCVYPTRTARFGTALTWGSHTPPDPSKPPNDSGACVLRIKGSAMAEDLRPVDASCECAVCKTFSRAYLHQLFCARSEVAASLLSYHNVYYMMRLMRTLRQSIIDGNYPEYVADFMLRMYPDGRYPEWAQEALQKGEIPLVKVDAATAKAAQAAPAPARRQGQGQGQGGKPKGKKLTKKERQERRALERKERAAAHAAATAAPVMQQATGDSTAEAQPKRSRIE
jgi:tRNA-guanine transglycosylase